MSTKLYFQRTHAENASADQPFHWTTERLALLNQAKQWYPVGPLAARSQLIAERCGWPAEKVNQKLLEFDSQQAHLLATPATPRARVRPRPAHRAEPRRTEKRHQAAHSATERDQVHGSTLPTVAECWDRDDAGKHTLLSREQEMELVSLMHAGGTAGEAARERFIACNQGLVHQIARRFLAANRAQGMDYEDLVQEGQIGLIRAVSKFDPARGYKFSTMATWWIRQAISRALDDQQPAIHIPAYKLTELRRLERAHQQLLQQFGQQPSVSQLAEAAEMTIELVESLLALRRTRTLRSLDEPLDKSDEQATFGSLLPDPDSEPESQALDTVMNSTVLQALRDLLNPRELLILNLRLGLSGREHSLEEVGHKLNVTRERIRQIEERALLKLRRSSLGSWLAISQHEEGNK